MNKTEAGELFDRTADYKGFEKDKPYSMSRDKFIEVTAGTGEGDYIPCGGCGNDNPSKRCIGCLHPFVRTPAASIGEDKNDNL